MASCTEEKVNKWLTGKKENKRESTLIFLLINLELQPFSHSEGLTGAVPTSIYFSAKNIFDCQSFSGLWVSNVRKISDVILPKLV